MNIDAQLEDLIRTSGYGDTTYHQFLHKLVLKTRPKSVLEVGSFYGSTAIVFYRAMQEYMPCPKLSLIDNAELLDPTVLGETMRRFGVAADITIGKDTDNIPYRPAELIHLDAAHDVEGVTRELDLAHLHRPSCIVVHDMNNAEVSTAVGRFVATHLEDYNMSLHTEVFHHCAVLTR